MLAGLSIPERQLLQFLLGGGQWRAVQIPVIRLP
jgi:hypothetical protein